MEEGGVWKFQAPVTSRCGVSAMERMEKTGDNCRREARGASRPPRVRLADTQRPTRIGAIVPIDGDALTQFSDVNNSFQRGSYLKELSSNGSLTFRVSQFSVAFSHNIPIVCDLQLTESTRCPLFQRGSKGRHRRPAP
jgi:hypothetical protein